MFKWQNHRSVWQDRTRWRAVLMECVRINHKPGSSTSRSSKATEKATCTSAAPAWRRARKRLDELAYRITPEDRSKIEDALALRVPLPTPEFF
jgi:hypothetical protein